MSIQLVGVVGAGVMGAGVAQNLAQTGHRVILVDVSENALAKAEQEIKDNIRFQTLFKKGPQNSVDALGNITFSVADELLKDVDFVIENVTEKWDIKRGVYQRIDEICPAHCVFAANTSAISITRIASLTKRALKVVGIHFMNPVALKPMVEVIRGHHTSEETLQTAGELLAQMGKEYIVVNDSPGFVSNRVLMLMINEAIFLLQDQVASVEDVDRIFKSCFGHKMGPLETADLIGLDTILFSIEVLYESFNDSKYRPCPLLRKMVDAGLHGRKSGQGFYSY
jgi:3-hydroxybutyryl-CoA dehydrogenase